MSTIMSGRVHVIAGGYPPGALGGHDMDYARLRLLGMLEEHGLLATVGNDFSDITPLAGLHNLETLVLLKNRVSDISALAGLTKLEHLDIHRVQMSPFSNGADAGDYRRTRGWRWRGGSSGDTPARPSTPATTPWRPRPAGRFLRPPLAGRRGP